MSTTKTRIEGVMDLEKYLFCNHHSKDWLRQESSINAKCDIGGWMRNKIFAFS